MYEGVNLAGVAEGGGGRVLLHQKFSPGAPSYLAKGEGGGSLQRKCFSRCWSKKKVRLVCCMGEMLATSSVGVNKEVPTSRLDMYTQVYLVTYCGTLPTLVSAIAVLFLHR